MDRFLKISPLFLIMFMLYSCEEKPPAPEVSFTAEVNSNVVKFNSEATNAETFEWDFGDETKKSAEEDPVHVYTHFDYDYTVKLKVTGKGGDATATKKVTIPPMTGMQILSGTDTLTEGRKWRLSQSAPVIFAKPDTLFTVVRTFTAGFLSSAGFPNAYKDEYIFSRNGSFNINLKGTGIIGSLSYCTAKGIPNIIPSQAAGEANLTIISSYTIPDEMTYGLNEGKDLTLTTLTDGRAGTVTFRRVKTLSLSYDAFLGIRGWMNELVILEATKSTLKVACFTSTVPSGKISGALILTFEAED
jgi:PKD repeat protein